MGVLHTGRVTSFFLGLALWGSAALAVLNPAQAKTKDQIIAEQLAAMKGILMEVDTHYGMAKFKKEHFNVDTQAMEAKYTQLIQSARTLEESNGMTPAVKRETLSKKEFQQLMIGLAAEFKDGHFNILRNSRQAWTLGLNAAAMGGRLYVTGAKPNLFDLTSTFPRIQVGDEITSINGVDIQEIARQNEIYISLATPASRQAFALEMAVNRSERWLMPVTSGDEVTVGFRRGDTEFTGRLHWINSKDVQDVTSLSRYVFPNPEIFDLQQMLVAAARPYVYGQSSTRKSYFSEGLNRLGLPEGSINDVGTLLNTEIQQAPLKKALGMKKEARRFAGLKPVGRLSAYTVSVNGTNLGVIRLPDYSPSSVREVINEINWLAEIIKRFEHTTDGLIIDQLSNGGGYVYMFSQLIRLFAKDGEIPTQTIDMKLNETLLAHLDHVDHPLGVYNPKLDGSRIPLSQAVLKKELLERLRKKFEDGDEWSGPVSHASSNGLDLMPGKAGQAVAVEGRVYTKPILILNDGRSASGGDFFPAVMQSAGRALVFGETSMGLGGPVYRSQASMPGSELTMRCTMGYCERPDGLPIENLGVVPDVTRKIQPDDLSNGFALYARDVLTTMVNHMRKAPADAIQAYFTKKAIAEGDVPPESDTLAGLKALLAAAKTSADYLQAYQAFFQTHEGELKAEKVEYIVRLPMPQSLLNQDLFLASDATQHGIVERLQFLIAQGRLSGADLDLARLLVEKVAEHSGSISLERDVCASMLTPFKKK